MSLTAEGCRARQGKLVEVLESERLDAAIISDRMHVLYFSGRHVDPNHASALLIDRTGRATLVSSSEPTDLAIDAYIPYVPSHLATMHSRQHEEVAEALEPAVSPGSYGADKGGGVSCITELGGDGVTDITPAIVRLRKSKWPDEVEALRASIRITEVMYETALDVVAPGADEMVVYSEILAAATREGGRFLEAFGNDFRANAIGGSPRRREMQAGELYVLDAGPKLNGYHADNCRTFAVDGSPSEAQMKVWTRIDSLFAILEDAIRPGVDPKDVFKLADEYLTWEGFEGMIHHLGHGVGLRPHEAPELNPNYDTVFEEGDFFTMEPGLYSDELKAGMRLEENYLVTADGIERLTRFPRSLTR